MAFLTHIDEVCPEIERITRNVYKSGILKEKKMWKKLSTFYSDPPSPLSSQPWRTLSTSTEENTFLKSYQPRSQGVRHLRILLHGPVGAGKSSFVNSVDSALRGTVANRAETNATGSSVTSKYKTYRIEKDDQSIYSFVFNDIMGLEVKNGVQVEDIKLALEGHVRDGYKFRTDSRLLEKDPSYNSEPSLDDKVHVLVCVVPADKVSLLDDKVEQKLREVRLAARDLGIPQLAILTKVDEACPEVNNDINNLYKSKKLKEQVEKLSEMLGIPISSIFLVKNYHSEAEVCDAINGPILTALRQMVKFGEDYLNDMSTQVNLNFLKSYQPRKKGVRHLRILLHGPVGAGKSSFFNSVDSALRGTVTNRAGTNANTESSFTSKYKTYRIEKDDQNFYSIIFNDIMGLDGNATNGVQVEDIKLALEGHVKDGYKFRTDSPLTETDPGYNSEPSLDDKVHMLVCVVPADKVSVLDDKVVQKLKEVRRAASDLGIPELAILTKVDEACPEVKSNINNIHKSEKLKEQVESFSLMLGIPINSIFLVKNYNSESYTCDDINGPILAALRQMVKFGEEYLKDVMRAAAMDSDLQCPPLPVFDQPWRSLPGNNKDNLDFVKNYRPESDDVKQLKILLHGPVGAGKSSFINSVDSVLQGRITGRALTDATSSNSFTMRYRSYPIRRDAKSIYSLVFHDITGFEKQKGVLVEDVKLALSGRVKEGYEFKPDQQLKKGHEGYNSSPSLQDKTHVLVCVVPTDAASVISQEVLTKMREVRVAASRMGIPQLAILTKVDKSCDEVQNDLTYAYKSTYTKEQVDKYSELLGIQPNCIFLVKNYNSESKTSEAIDNLILYALRQMLEFGEDFLNDQVTCTLRQT